MVDHCNAVAIENRTIDQYYKRSNRKLHVYSLTIQFSSHYGCRVVIYYCIAFISIDQQDACLEIR